MAIRYEHPVYGGIWSDPGVYYGSNRVQGMYYGEKLVYPSTMSYSTNFSYGQTSWEKLATASRGQWTAINDEIEVTVTADGVITTGSANTDWTYYPMAQWATRMNKYEIEVSATLAENLRGEATHLFIGKPRSTGKFFCLSMASGAVQLARYTGRLENGSSTDISSNVKPVAGDKVTLRRSRVAGSSNVRADVLVNGVWKWGWDKYTGMPAPGPLDQNVGGVIMTFRRQSWTNYYCAKLTDFSINTF